MTTITPSTICLVTGCLLVVFTRSAQAVPVLGECLPGGDVTELCERCAKFTKATNVFGLCCNKESKPDASDNANRPKSVRNWCIKFLKLELPYYNIGGQRREIEVQ